MLRMKWYVVMVMTVMMVSAKNLDDLLNTCIDSKHHKSMPGPESKLFKQVNYSQWYFYHIQNRFLNGIILTTFKCF